MKLSLSFSIQSTTDRGKQHGNADSLSRSNCKQCGLEFISEEVEETSCGCLSTGVQVLPVWTKVELREMQEADPNLGDMIKWQRLDCYLFHVLLKLFGNCSLFGYRGTTSCLKMACCVDNEKMSKVMICTLICSWFCRRI